METMLGFFNRPFLPLPLEEALTAIQSCGTNHVGLLGRPGGGAYVEWNTPYSEIEEMHRLFDARGMRLHAVLAHVSFDVDKDEAIKRYQQFIDRAVAVGAKHLLEMGAHKPETYDTYIEIMKAVSPYAHERGLIIGIKPHGGISTSGSETADVVNRVGHPGFQAWYDPGNILYYKQLDPVAEARYFDGITVGVCVKDCVIEADGKPSVNVTPGSGQVDFEAVFRVLKEGGFTGGPCLIETLGPQDPEGAVQAGKLGLGYIAGVLERVGF
ncbi:MAG: sugar phosphate isomerase/epimerase family protein [Anaerolineae bacterium]|jgi:sugar phosphate isomerase/epimerase